MTKSINLRQQFQAFEQGIILDSNGGQSRCFNFYDWFCKETSLEAKSKKLYRQAINFCKEFDIDLDTNYVFFKNNCPLDGSLYDSFSICNVETGDVQYWVCASSGFNYKKGQAEISGRVNGEFKLDLYVGSNLREIYRQRREEKSLVTA
jgi:hypothetical protein